MTPAEQPAGPTRGEHGLAALLLLLFTLIFFHEAVFQGKILSPIDAACPIDVVWNEACGDIKVAQNGLIGSDQAAQFYPWRAFVREMWHQGIAPLWNPYNFSGYPFQANAQTAIFYPINLLSNLLPLRYLFTFSAVMRLFMAAWGTYLLGRALGLSFYAGLLAGLAFGFSSGLVAWLGYAIVDVLAFFPLLLYFTEKLLQTNRLRFMFAAALALGIMGLGGHPQTLLVSGLFWGGYSLARLLILWIIEPRVAAGSTATTAPVPALFRSLGRPLLYLIGVGLLAGGLAAIQLLPTWQAIRDSYGYFARLPSEPDLFEAKMELARWLSLGLLIWPNFFGNPAWPEVGSGTWLGYRNYNELAIYLGIVPLLLVPWAFLERRRRWMVWLYSLWVLLAAGFFLRLPLFYALSQFSILARIEVDRLRLFATFGLVILAGYGLDVFLQRQRRAYIAAIFVLILALSLTVGQLGLKLTNAGLRIPGAEITLANIWQVAQETPFQVPFWAGDYLNPTLVFGLPLLLTGALLIAVWFSPARSVKFAALLVVLTALDLFMINAGFNTAVEPELEASHLIAKSETLTFLQQILKPTDRLVAFGPTLMPNSATLLGISDVRGYDITVANRYHRLFSGSPGFHVYGPGGFFLTQPNPALNIFSVNYVLTPSPIPDLYPVFEAKSGLLVYHLPEALPRAYLAPQAQQAAPDMIYQTITSGGFDPAATALIEQAPPAWWRPPAEAALGPAEVTDYQPNRVAVETHSPVSAFLVLTDSYDAGWNVYVDGRPQPLYRTNYVLRGLFLEAGPHQVTFVYEPPAFKAGAALSLATLVMIGAGLLGDLLNLS